MTLRQAQGDKARDEVAVGRIAGAFGLTGELKCDPTSAGRSVFTLGAQLRCARGAESRAIRITGVRPHRERLLIRVAGVDDPEAAKAYAGALLFAPRERIELQSEEYFADDLLGCVVRGVDGSNYGIVERVEHYPASDMLIVDGRMIPMVRAIVTEVDLARRRIVVDPPPGLLD